MRGVLAALVVALGAAAGAAGAERVASLRLVAQAPLTLHGARFHVKEPVRVVVRMGGTKVTRTVRTSAAGGFTVVIATAASYDPCNADLVATATGGRGDSAVLKLPQRACPPSP